MPSNSGGHTDHPTMHRGTPAIPSLQRRPSEPDRISCKKKETPSQNKVDRTGPSATKRQETSFSVFKNPESCQLAILGKRSPAQHPLGMRPGRFARQGPLPGPFSRDSDSCAIYARRRRSRIPVPQFPVDARPKRLRPNFLSADLRRRCRTACAMPRPHRRATGCRALAASIPGHCAFRRIVGLFGSRGVPLHRPSVPGSD